MPKSADQRSAVAGADAALNPLTAWTAGGVAPQALSPLGEYMTDAMQRTVLFWDVLRQRSDQYYAQREKDVPNVLSFDAELVLDARSFAKPVNYLLVRVDDPRLSGQTSQAIDKLLSKRGVGRGSFDIRDPDSFVGMSEMNTLLLLMREILLSTARLRISS